MSTQLLASRRLDADFFDRSVHDVARDLIGCALLFDGVGGVIVECESYERDDPACHAYVGLTAGPSPCSGRPGTPTCTSPMASTPAQLRLRARGQGGGGADSGPGAGWGIEEMSRRRGRDRARDLCSGPGKLTEALGIGLEMNRAPLTEPPFELRGREDGRPRSRS